MMETDPLLNSRVAEPVYGHEGTQANDSGVKADFNAKLVGLLLIDSIPG